MAFNLFGFLFKDPKPEKSRPSFAPPSNDDGAVIIDQGGAYQTVLDIDGTVRSEIELITKYRETARLPEVDGAINEIVNESVVAEENKTSVALVTDKLTYGKDVIAKIQAEFDNVMNLLDFNNEGQDLFRKWYIDGRLYFHMIIDNDKPRDGIKELRNIDPRLIKLVIETETQMANDGVPVQTEKQRYYTYNQFGVDANTAAVSQTGIRIATDSICYVHSGIQETNNTMILGHLQKALKPANMLTMTEDATVIYRLSRAPERRVFYIDVGSLPKQKAEQYLKDIMARYRNKMVYDASTGEIREDKRFLSFMEDYWLPRREGGRGTEITTLPGGENLGEMADVEYFKEKLYQSLNVPVGRLKPDTGFSVGRATEITRDEIKFGKFVFRLRNRFTQLFDVILSTQLMLKGIISKEDWQVIRQKVFYDFLKDTYFSEMKNLEIIRERLGAVDSAVNYVGKYYSHEWVRRNILQQTDQEMQLLDNQMSKEKKDPRYQAVEAMTGMGMGMGMGMDQMGQPGMDGGMGVDPNAMGGQPMDTGNAPPPQQQNDDEDEGPQIDPENLPTERVTRNVEALWRR